MTQELMIELISSPTPRGKQAIRLGQIVIRPLFAVPSKTFQGLS